MKYYKDAAGEVWAFEEDGSQDEWIPEGAVLMTAEEVDAHLHPPITPEMQHQIDSYAELAWQELEMAFIANQLLAIEDGDPTALPGTDRQWRDYRIKVRAWKEGNPDFPDGNKRPVRPS